MTAHSTSGNPYGLLLRVWTAHRVRGVTASWGRVRSDPASFAEPSDIRARVWAISMALVALSLCPPPVGAQGTEALELQVMRTVAVPVGFVVNGAALLPDGTPVVWGPTGVFVLSATGPPEFFESPVNVQPRGLRVINSPVPTIEIVGPAGDHITLGSAPDSSQLQRPREEFEILQSASFGNGWFVLTAGDQNDSGPDQLWFLSGGSPEGGSPVLLAYPSAHWQHSVHLTAAGHEVLATEITAPFRTWRLRLYPEDLPRELKAELIHEEWLVPEQLVTQGFPEERTVALRAMRLDHGYLLQLGDLSNDRRLIILIDDRGELIRTRIVDVAMGFMVSEPSSRLLLAFRDVGRQEFVLYRWTWGGR